MTRQVVRQTLTANFLRPDDEAYRDNRQFANLRLDAADDQILSIARSYAELILGSHPGVTTVNQMIEIR